MVMRAPHAQHQAGDHKDEAHSPGLELRLRCLLRDLPSAHIGQQGAQKREEQVELQVGPHEDQQSEELDALNQHHPLRV